MSPIEGEIVAARSDRRVCVIAHGAEGLGRHSDLGLFEKKRGAGFGEGTSSST
ncbi:hypothetical protein M404DRAFT_997629, partial [Pisolithus tinctorius Marx 270]